MQLERLAVRPVVRPPFQRPHFPSSRIITYSVMYSVKPMCGRYFKAIVFTPFSSNRCCAFVAGCSLDSESSPAEENPQLVLSDEGTPRTIDSKRDATGEKELHSLLASVSNDFVHSRN